MHLRVFCCEQNHIWFGGLSANSCSASSQLFLRRSDLVCALQDLSCYEQNYSKSEGSRDLPQNALEFGMKTLMKVCQQSGNNSETWL